MALTKAGNIVLRYPYRKNLIINGDFKIWQRGTSLAGIINTGRYLADRFITGSSCEAILSVTRSTSVPTFAASGRNWPYSHYVSVTTADTSIGANQFAEVAYKIEGYDIIPLMGRTCTLSFWSAASKTGIYCVALRNNLTGPDRSYIMEYTQTVASTWQFNKLTFTMHDGTSGTWDFTNGMGLDIWFMLACGSTYQTTPNAWQTGNYIATSNQTNLMDTIGNAFCLTGVQLELGPVATPFEYRPYVEELALCQRYYEKSYDQSVYPGAISGIGQMVEIAPRNAVEASYGWRFSTRKRTTPLVHLYADNTGTIDKIRNTGDKTASAAYIGESGVGYISITSGVTNDTAAWHWTADAEF